MLQGEGFHRDNTGNDETIKAGDVQWMFAGKGILHSEGPTKQVQQNGGVQELIQLWINAPRANKWDKPFTSPPGKNNYPRYCSRRAYTFGWQVGNMTDKPDPFKTLPPLSQ
ncbi:pirin family protein [Paraflavitalea speifideaquila]|uniref:pirin family protein n=1 Tax=Paraflavitalea speifideaquila TaxID=3076558 RepID=UPI0028EC0F09|nr:pirin family protein [Paraflavitalea speifideiaquila]